MQGYNEILVECIKAAGGSKAVAPLLWPEKMADAAQRLLLDCMNEDRPAHLTPDQAVLVMRMARAKGCHLGMEYLAESLGYGKPVPVEPRDENAELQRQFIAATSDMAAMLARMEQLQASINKPVNSNLRAA